MAFKRLAASPDNIADVIFSSAGRMVVRDQGLVSIIFRVILKSIDLGFFCELATRFAHLSGDHQRLWLAYQNKHPAK